MENCDCPMVNCQVLTVLPVSPEATSSDDPFLYASIFVQ